MANYATSALKLSDTYVNTLPYNTCSTAAGTAAKTVSAGSFALETGAMVVVKFTYTNTAANPTLNVSSTGAKAIYLNGSAITASLLKANTVYQFCFNGTQWDLVGPPIADGTTPGLTIVYPAASCTTFSSDSGTVTPLAVQKGAKQFAITRPSSVKDRIARFTNTTGDLESSKITIEDVTNTRDNSKKAQVIAIPAEKNMKMVYGYCTDQVDGTSFIGGIFPADATTYPYNEGLAIGGTSGNLLWKGKQVATTDMITVSSVNNSTGHVYVPSCYSGTMSAAASNVHTLTINEVLSGATTMLVTVTTEFSGSYTSGNAIKVTGKYKSGNTSEQSFTASVDTTSSTTKDKSILKDMKNNNAPTNAFVSKTINQIMLKLTRSGTTVKVEKVCINSAVATWN